MLELIADHMENGFLENIIDMFKHDRGLYSIVPDLMSDERSRVRIGTVALIENLRDTHVDEVAALVKDVAGLLKNENPAVRADTAYLLGTIGHEDAVEYLKDALDEKVEPVRQVIVETIEELKTGA
jgi:HEAT repeat protein